MPCESRTSLLRIPLSLLFSEGFSEGSVHLAVPAAARISIFIASYELSCCCCIYVRIQGAMTHFVTRGDVVLRPGCSMHPQTVVCSSGVFQVLSATHFTEQRAPDKLQKCCTGPQATVLGDRSSAGCVVLQHTLVKPTGSVLMLFCVLRSVGPPSATARQKHT
jgi:hypothetical protein